MKTQENADEIYSTKYNGNLYERMFRRGDFYANVSVV